jgi:hypothetical protein
MPSGAQGLALADAQRKRDGPPDTVSLPDHHVQDAVAQYCGTGRSRLRVLADRSPPDCNFPAPVGRQPGGELARGQPQVQVCSKSTARLPLHLVVA